MDSFVTSFILLSSVRKYCCAFVSFFFFLEMPDLLEDGLCSFIVVHPVGPCNPRHMHLLKVRVLAWLEIGVIIFVLPFL
jgi:hypothetical protein